MQELRAIQNYNDYPRAADDEHEALVKFDHSCTFIGEQSHMETNGDTLSVRCETLKLAQSGRRQFAARSDCFKAPQAVVLLQCCDRKVVLRVATSSAATQLVGMPPVVVYSLPERRAHGAAPLDVAKWFGFVDALLCVVPYVVQLPLQPRSAAPQSLANGVREVVPIRTKAPLKRLVDDHFKVYEELRPRKSLRVLSESCCAS